MGTLEWRFIMNYKLPVLGTTCGHLHESCNSRFSESNDVKNEELYTSAQCPAWALVTDPSWQHAAVCSGHSAVH